MAAVGLLAAPCRWRPAALRGGSAAMAAEGSWAPPAGGGRQQWLLRALGRPLQVSAGGVGSNSG